MRRPVEERRTVVKGVLQHRVEDLFVDLEPSKDSEVVLPSTPRECTSINPLSRRLNCPARQAFQKTTSSQHLSFSTSLFRPPFRHFSKGPPSARPTRHVGLPPSSGRSGDGSEWNRHNRNLRQCLYQYRDLLTYSN